MGGATVSKRDQTDHGVLDSRCAIYNIQITMIDIRLILPIYIAISIIYHHGKTYSYIMYIYK